jgi:hypothetical protein
MPIGGFRSPESLQHRIDELQRLAKEAGRAPIPVSVFGAPARKELLETYAAMGVHRCTFFVQPERADAVLPRLKHYAEVCGL